MHPSLKNVTERAQKWFLIFRSIRDFVSITGHPLNIALKKTFQLKNASQKCDFSVNFHILIEQTGFRSDILCQKGITCHCVFPLNIALKKTFQLKNAP